MEIMIFASIVVSVGIRNALAMAKAAVTGRTGYRNGEAGLLGPR
jgi:hypothetical protein